MISYLVSRGVTPTKATIIGVRFTWLSKSTHQQDLSRKIGIMQYETTLDQFEGLHNALAKVRKNSTTVKVDRQALINILMDHSELARQLEGHIS